MVEARTGFFKPEQRRKEYLKWFGKETRRGVGESLDPVREEYSRKGMLGDTAMADVYEPYLQRGQELIAGETAKVGMEQLAWEEGIEEREDVQAFDFEGQKSSQLSEYRNVMEQIMGKARLQTEQIGADKESQIREHEFEGIERERDRQMELALAKAERDASKKRGGIWGMLAGAGVDLLTGGVSKWLGLGAKSVASGVTAGEAVADDSGYPKTYGYSSSRSTGKRKFLTEAAGVK